MSFLRKQLEMMFFFSFINPCLLTFLITKLLERQKKTSRGRARTKHKAGLRSAHGDTAGRAGRGWEDGVRDSESEGEKTVFRFDVREGFSAALASFSAFCKITPENQTL